MKIQKIELISKIAYSGLLQKGMEMEQHLILLRDGEVRFASYDFGGREKKKTVDRQQQFNEWESTNQILELFEKYFDEKRMARRPRKKGNWTLSITLENGKKKNISSIQNEVVEVDGINLSEFLRGKLPIYRLVAFDGNAGAFGEEDVVNFEISSMNTHLMRFSEYQNLKTDVQKLRIENSQLLTERDELMVRILPDLRMQYVLEFGDLEYQVYQVQCSASKLEKKLALIEKKAQEKEKISIVEIDKLLEEEFAEYQNELHQEIDEMRRAMKEYRNEQPTQKELKELNKLYRQIMQEVHPDLQQESKKQKSETFEKTVAAYENADMNTLRQIEETLKKTEPPEEGQEEMIVFLVKERERLQMLAQELRESMEDLKSQFPYTEKELLENREKCKEYKFWLEEIAGEYQKSIVDYSEKIQKFMEET